jgi:hypothetical protein
MMQRFSGLNFDGPELSYRLPRKELENRENAEKMK